MSQVVVVTGATGFLGSHLVPALMEKGWDVRAVSRRPFAWGQNVQHHVADVANRDALRHAVEGADAVVHLAALLHPRSERDKSLTFTVNVGGTETIISAMEEASADGTLVFASSVSTYGDTSSGAPPVGITQPQSAIDVYADSKIAAESAILNSPLSSVILRIAPIAVPAFLEPPEVWPFTKDQRVEMVHRDDVVDALFAAAGSHAEAGTVFNIAGGASWQLTGTRYVEDFYGFLGAPLDDAIYRSSAGWVDWYNTTESQRLLKYQNRSYDFFSQEMKTLIDEMMAG